MNRVVVLGASGFIGRRIMHALGAQQNFRPVAVSRNAAARRWPDGVEAQNADASDAAALRSVIREAAAVVNCIAGDPALILEASARVFEAAAAMSPRPRVVHLSSLAAYGSATGLIQESCELRGDLDGYSAAKAQSDRLAALHDFVVTLRPGIVFGPESPWWSDRIARLLIAGRLGDLGDRGSGICNLVYVDDVAGAVVMALQAQGLPQRVFNLSCSAGLTWNEYFSRYAAALSAAPLRKISARRLKMETALLSPPLKLLELALRKPAWARWNPLPPIRPWLAEICARNIQMDVSRAESLLGMRWTPLERGLALTAGWFRAGGRTAI